MQQCALVKHANCVAENICGMTSAIKNFAEFRYVIQIYKIRSICNGRNSEILKPVFSESAIFLVHLER